MVPDPEEAFSSVDNGEFDFLIAKYLRSGPFKDVGDRLAKDLEEKKNETYNHVEPDHLLKVAQNVGRSGDDSSRANNVEGSSSVLQSAGCGRLDVLRTPEGSKRARWNTRDLLYSRNPWVPRTVPAVIASQTVPMPGEQSSLPSWPHLCAARQIHGFLHPDVMFSKKYYKDFQLHKRILGHLAAVFNVIFDRSGKFLITGSDDRLLKLWSSSDGRLLFTFRGHVSEIVFMAINDENTMLASVATDRMIRVWNLQNGAQIVVHKHPAGFVSSLKFSPSVRGNYRFLVASSMDGTITCWKYDAKTLEFLPGEVTINEKTIELPETKICSISFSSGGTFMASGSVDCYVRVYNLMADGGPVRIMQKALHSDRVDSNEYCHVGDRLLTGSKDGTGRIWSCNLKNEWTTVVLNSAQSLSVPGSERHDPKAYKRKVTMVGWSLNDQYCILASDDNVMRVFDSFDGRLVFELTGHIDTVYVLENHPFDTNVYLTAGHDAKLILWSLIDGSQLCVFQQWIPGHGPSPFVDAKWSPDGTMIAAVDMFGMLNIYGPGKGSLYAKTPEEQFFHTDFRPLMKDALGFVIDEQTQLQPNLMQPPFLVSAGGDPYPPEIQRLVPGRNDINNETPQVPDEPLPALNAALDGLNNQAMIPGVVQPLVAAQAIGVQYVHPPDPYKRIYVPQPLDPLLATSLHQRRKDLAILEIEKWREHSRLTGKESAASRRAESEFNFVAPPRQLLMSNSSMNGEPSSATIPSVEAQPFSAGLNPSGAGQFIGLDNADDSDDEDYDAPVRNADDSEDESELSDMDGSIASVEARQTRGAEGIALVGTRRSARKRKQREESSEHDITDEEEEADEEEYRESVSVNGHDNGDSGEASTSRPPRLNLRSTQPTNGEPSVPVVRPPPKKGRKRPTSARKTPAKKIKVERNPGESLPATARVPLGVDTSPPKWLSEVLPRRSPYFPQVDDLLYYYVQAHKKYNNVALREGSSAERVVKANRPWETRTLDLSTVELLKVKEVKFTIKKPLYRRVAEITVERVSDAVVPVDPRRKNSFKIMLQEIADAEDFLTLAQFVEQSRQRPPLTVGQRVRALFYDAKEENVSELGEKEDSKGDETQPTGTGEWQWFNGKIEAIDNEDPDYPGSDYHSLSITWDEGAVERLSPWDVFPLEKPEPADKTFLTTAEVMELAYKPEAGDWDCYSLEALRERVLPLLDQITEHNHAEHFNAPVDYVKYYDYSHYVPYPVDLMMIRQRLVSGFYRHRSALIQDISQLRNNAELYNGPAHTATKSAYIISEVFLAAVQDESLRSNVRTVFANATKKWEGAWKERLAAFKGTGPSRQSNGQAGNRNGKTGRFGIAADTTAAAADLTELSPESESEPEPEEDSSEFAPSDGESEDDRDAVRQPDYSAEEESTTSGPEPAVDEDDDDYGAPAKKRLRSAGNRRNNTPNAVNGRRRPTRTTRSKDKESPETSISTNRKRAKQAAGRHRKRAARRGGGGGRRGSRSTVKKAPVKALQRVEDQGPSMYGRVRTKLSYAEMEGSDGDINTPSPAESGTTTLGSSSNDAPRMSRSGRPIRPRRLAD